MAFTVLSEIKKKYNARESSLEKAEHKDDDENVISRSLQRSGFDDWTRGASKRRLLLGVRSARQVSPKSQTVMKKPMSQRPSFFGIEEDFNLFKPKESFFKP